MKTNPAIESLRTAMTTAFIGTDVCARPERMVSTNISGMRDRVQKTLGGEVATWYGLSIDYYGHPDYYVVTTDGVVGHVSTIQARASAYARYSWHQERFTVRKVKRLPAEVAGTEQTFRPWLVEQLAAVEGEAAEKAVAEEAAAEKAAAEKAAAETTPVEETPVEEAPAVETESALPVKTFTSEGERIRWIYAQAENPLETRGGSIELVAEKDRTALHVVVRSGSWGKGLETVRKALRVAGVQTVGDITADRVIDELTSACRYNDGLLHSEYADGEVADAGTDREPCWSITYTRHTAPRKAA